MRDTADANQQSVLMNQNCEKKKNDSYKACRPTLQSLNLFSKSLALKRFHNNSNHRYKLHSVFCHLELYIMDCLDRNISCLITKIIDSCSCKRRSCDFVPVL